MIYSTIKFNQELISGCFFQALATEAPTVGEALAQPPAESEHVVVKPAEISVCPEPKAASNVAPATTDYNKFASEKIPHRIASNLSVSVLKQKGVDFEGEAAVIKGRVTKNALRRWLPMIYDERDFISFGESKRYVFIKSDCIFVYGQKIDPKPLYVIQLETIRGEVEDPNNPHKNSYTVSPQAGNNRTGSNLVTVLLMDRVSGKQSYQITFDSRTDKSLVKKFMDTLQSNSKHYGVEVVSASVVEGRLKMDLHDGSKECK